MTKYDYLPVISLEMLPLGHDYNFRESINKSEVKMTLTRQCPDMRIAYI